MFDLSTLDQSTDLTFDVPVVFGADGEAVSGFKVVGRNSQQYRDAKRKQDVLAIKKAAQRGKTPDGKTDAGAESLIDDVTHRETAVAIACVVEWYGFSKGGAALALSEDALIEVFSKRPTWLSKVSAAVAADENFTQS